jgi:hypothetical protein
VKKFIIGAAGFGLLAASSVGLAGTASASTADTVINDLQADGYIVQINGATTAPLTACKVNSVNKFDDGTSASVDIACPPGCGSL